MSSVPPEYIPFIFLKDQAQIPSQGTRATVNLGLSDRLFEKNRKWTLDKVNGNYADKDLK